MEDELEYDYYTTLAKIFDTQDLVSPPFSNYEEDKSKDAKRIKEKRKEAKKPFRNEQRGGKFNDQGLL